MKIVPESSSPTAASETRRNSAPNRGGAAGSDVPPVPGTAEPDESHRGHNPFAKERPAAVAVSPAPATAASI